MNRPFRGIASLLFVLGLLGPSLSAHAGCLSYPSQAAPQAVTFGTVRVPADAAPGTVLAVRDSQPNFSPAKHKCDKASRAARLGVFRTPSTLGGGIYDTNIPGIGIRIRHFGFQLGFDNALVPSESPLPSWAFYPIVGAHFRVELVKTGPVTKAGDLSAGTIAEAGYDGHRQWWADLGATRIEPEHGTCAFHARHLVFDLGDVDGGTLVAQGHSRWANQSLAVTQCTNVTQIDMTFEGAAHDTDASLFRLDATPGTARGIGVELRSVYPDAQAMPNASVPLVFDVITGDDTYAFRARYRATGEAVSPGTANASITVRVAYR